MISLRLEGSILIGMLSSETRLESISRGFEFHKKSVVMFTHLEIAGIQSVKFHVGEHINKIAG